MQQANPAKPAGLLRPALALFITLSVITGLLVGWALRYFTHFARMTEVSS